MTEITSGLSTHQADESRLSGITPDQTERLGLLWAAGARWPDIWANPYLRSTGEHTRAYIERDSPTTANEAAGDATT